MSLAPMRVPRGLGVACQIATSILLFHGLSFAQTPGLEPSSHTPYDVGVNYHATTPDFRDSTFVRRYHDPKVRSVVRRQLQEMANSGASVVKTTLWQVRTPGSSWWLSFPLSDREVLNVETYARDVAMTQRRDGRYLDLQLTLEWLGCADYTKGSPRTTAGECNYSWETLTAYARQSIAKLLGRLGDVRRPDGRKAVSKLYLVLETMIGAKPNQDRFLLDIYPHFLHEAARAGLEGSLYFTIEPAEADILDDSYVDAEYPELNGHRSLYWIFRSVAFLAKNGLVVPDRLDFSFYPTRRTLPYATLVNRVFDDFQAVFPGYQAGVAETSYPERVNDRRELGMAFAAAYLARGLPEQVIFWSTPYWGTPADAGPPFDFSAFELAVPAAISSSVSASPTTCVIPPGDITCSTTISWSTSAESATAALWMDTGIESLILECGKNSQVTVSSIRPDVAYTFSLYATPACDKASTSVTGLRVASARVTASEKAAAVGTISATPQPCRSVDGSSCASTISWNATVSLGTATVFVKQENGPPELFACGTNGQQHASWIQTKRQYVFALYATPACGPTVPSNDALASVTVTGSD